MRVLLFTLECALGIVVVILVAALAHWSGWLSPVALLLYLLKMCIRDRVQIARRGVRDLALSMPKCSGASSSLPMA